MQLNRAPHESIESYITRASLYRGQLLGFDSSLAMGEAFYVGHLLDHAHLSRRDKAMIKTKAGSVVDEDLVTSAMVELAVDLEGEPGYPLGFSEPNMARNGEEWMVQRGEPRGRYGAPGPGRTTSGAPGGRMARQAFGAEWEEPVEHYAQVLDDGEDSLDESEAPPELLMRENEAFGMQYKVKQRIAEVKKLRQYYRRPDNDTKRKALAEQMKVNPCHNCGELGHWSRECPHPPKGNSSTSAPKAQQAFVARARPLRSVKEEPEDREWDLLVSLCRGQPQSASELKASPSPQYKGVSACESSHVVLSVTDVEGHEVLWSLQELAFKIILDIGCMRSVAGVQWANLLANRWRKEGRWLAVEPESETFRFGGGEVLRSRFRLSFVGSFAGRPVIYSFSIVEGSCPPLFSRSGCTQLGANIDCERHTVSSRRLGVKNYGVGQDSGHYTLSVDECEHDCADIPSEFRVEAGLDAMPVNPAVLRAPEPSVDPLSSEANGSSGRPEMQAVPEPGPQDQGVPDDRDRGVRGRRQLPSGGHGPRRGAETEANGATSARDQGWREGSESFGCDEQLPGASGRGLCGGGEHCGADGRGDELAEPPESQAGSLEGQSHPEEGLDGSACRLPVVVPCLEQRGGLQPGGLHGEPHANVPLEEGGVATADSSGCGGRREPAVEEESQMALDVAGQGGGESFRPLRVDAAEDAVARDLVPHVKLNEGLRPNRGTHQRIKAGLKKVREALAVMDQVVRDPGKKLLVEVFAGDGMLSSRARLKPNWMAAPPIGRETGWDLGRSEDQKKLLRMVEEFKPDLVTFDPPCQPWCGGGAHDLEDPKLWDRRREHLPFWRLVATVWRKQTEGGRLVLLCHPVNSQAFHLNFMADRVEVIRGVVPLCSFGLQDPETQKPYLKKVFVEANNKAMVRQLLQGAYCTHRLGEHQGIQGFCKMSGGWVRRSDVAARWPEPFCDRILESAEAAGMQEAGPRHVALHAESPRNAWETLAVSNSAVPDEGLRQELAKHAMTGERYDFVCFDGAANQQPRRLRALVAHLHVTLGHLSNERLSRMLRLSGASESAVSLAGSLRCQVCAMTRPPQNSPQVAYSKPKFFNERVSGDTFYIWDSTGAKFAATHYIDALTDYQVADLTDRPDSSFSREVFQDLWLAVFGPPDVLVTDGGPEFMGSVSVMLDLFGVVQEVVPEGAKWRLGQAERHGAVLKLMVMKMVKSLDLKGLKDMRHAVLASVAAKNRTLNRGGISPMQAVTGRNTMIPGSLMQQLASGHVKFKYNEAVGHSEAIARAERIRIGALEAFHWLDSHDALRRALASKSRPPQLEGVREGAIVYVYDPPASRRGLARRMQDNSSWSGPGVIVCVERDRPVPQRVWVRLRGRVKAFPLEKIRLATVDEMASAEFITQAVTDVEEELRGGRLRLEDGGSAEGERPDQPRTKPDGPSSSSSSSSEAEAEEPVDPEAQAQQEARARLLDDVPFSVARNFEDKRKREAEAQMDPHQLDFQKKQKLFESLVKQLEPPSPLEEAALRNHLEETYAKFKGVRKASKVKPRGAEGRSRGDGGHSSKAEGSRARAVMEVSQEDVEQVWFRPGEMEALLQDTVGQWALWGESSPHGEYEVLVQVSKKVAHAEQEGLTEVVTGKARVEYKWSSLDDTWKRAFVEPLKKAVGVYMDHDAIKGVALDQVVDPSRVLNSRFVLTNKGGPGLDEAELKARWILGGHRDPDAGLYATASPTASTLGHNLLNFVAVQMQWVIHYEDVSAAFLQGKELPRVDKVYVKVPHGYPNEVLEYLTGRLGGRVRSDMVELTKAGFGLPESPRLWYLEYKDTIEALGLKELALVPGLFRAFHPSGELRAMASIHVDDTRYAGDSTSQALWDGLHAKLKFGKLRKATEGWQKFCGRWERQCPETLELQYSMTEYTKEIPMAKLRPKDEKTTSQRTEGPGCPSTATGIARASSTSSPGCSSTAAGIAAPSISSPGCPSTAAGIASSSTSSPGCPTSVSADDAEVIALMADAVHKVVGPEEALTESERKVIGSVVGRLNWAARQGRYDLAFVSSSIQQLAGRGDPAALRVLNQGVKRAREDIVMPVRNLGCRLEDMVIVSVSDAAYGAMPGGHSQAGLLILVAAPDILHGTAPVCALEGTSSKIQRVVRCSMSAEVSALATCFEHGDFVRAVFCELIDHKFALRRWKVSVSRWPHYLVTDARTGYDALNSDTLPTDRKVAIDVAVLRQAIVEDDTSCFVRWVPGSEMPCDGLTKWADNHTLCRLLTTGSWALMDNPEAQELRRQAGLKRAAWRKAAKSRASPAPEGA